jgi:hypothetical protein
MNCEPASAAHPAALARDLVKRRALVRDTHGAAAEELFAAATAPLVSALTGERVRPGINPWRAADLASVFLAADCARSAADDAADEIAATAELLWKQDTKAAFAYTIQMQPALQAISKLTN